MVAASLKFLADPAAMSSLWNLHANSCRQPETIHVVQASEPSLPCLWLAGAGKAGASGLGHIHKL